ncbi:MAG: GDSL-type esterase/lipase family protein [Alicyclobacillaceae bacterium]|nr:GDSL-type esterase/lipase family protein [Alicyclobacillaceae bacterium]
MLYVALGDSITAGEAASAPQFTYTHRLVKRLSATCQKSVCGEVLAEPGFTCQALQSAVLENSPTVLSAAGTVTIWVGGDNLIDAALQSLSAVQDGLPTAAVRIKGGSLKQTLATAVRHSISGYSKSLETLVRHIRSVSKCRVVLCGQYNPFPNSPLATAAIGTLNQATATIATSTGCAFAATEQWFAGRERELIAGYRNGRVEDVLSLHVPPVHPNDRGHQVIAEGLYPFVAPL